MTTPLQTSLTTGLAMGFGGLLVHTLSGAPAIGYPAGSAVSAGSNPVVSTGGGFSFETASSTTQDVFTAPDDQDLIITDVDFSASSGNSSCGLRAKVDMWVDGEQVAAYTPMSSMMRFYSSETAFMSANNAQQSLISGIRVPAGTTLSLEVKLYEWGGSYCSHEYDQSIRYTLSGYYAQP